MSIVSKMLQCAVCYRWMAHLALIVFYIEFAWNYARFNSNDYYFMKTTHLLKPQSYARKLQNHSSVRTMEIPGWPQGSTENDAKSNFLRNIYSE